MGALIVLIIAAAINFVLSVLSDTFYSYLSGLFLGSALVAVYLL